MPTRPDAAVQSDALRIQNILDEMDRAESFSAGLSPADLRSDQKTVYAVARALGLIGEAARKISAETRAVCPVASWEEMIRTADRLVDSYQDVDVPAVWEAAHGSYPAVRQTLQRRLAMLGVS